jgi:hypothetical protein
MGKKERKGYHIVIEEADCCPSPEKEVIFDVETTVIPQGVSVQDRIAEARRIQEEKARSKLFAPIERALRPVKKQGTLIVNRESRQVIDFSKVVPDNVLDKQPVDGETPFQKKIRENRNMVNANVISNLKIGLENSAVYDQSQKGSEFGDYINVIRNALGRSLPSEFVGLVLNDMLEIFDVGVLKQFAKNAVRLSIHVRNNLNKLVVGDVGGSNDLEEQILKAQVQKMKIRDLAESCITILSPIYAGANLLAKADNNPIPLNNINLPRAYQEGVESQQYSLFNTPEFSIGRNRASSSAGSAFSSYAGSVNEDFQDAPLFVSKQQIREGYTNNEGIYVPPYTGDLEDLYEEVGDDIYRPLEFEDDRSVSSRASSASGKKGISSESIREEAKKLREEKERNENVSKKLVFDTEGKEGNEVPVLPEDDEEESPPRYTSAKGDEGEVLITPVGQNPPEAGEDKKVDEREGRLFDFIDKLRNHSLTDGIGKSAQKTQREKRDDFIAFVERLRAEYRPDEKLNVERILNSQGGERGLKLLSLYLAVRDSSRAVDEFLEANLNKVSGQTGKWTAVKAIEALKGYGVKPLNKKHKTKLTAKEVRKIRMMGNDGHIV